MRRVLPLNRIVRRAGVAAVLVAALVWGGAAAALELVPYRAVYALSLLAARAASGVESVDGHMVAEYSESCTGWGLDLRSLISVADRLGATIRIDTSVETWEARDGRTYRFAVHNTMNDDVIETVAGVAKLPAGPGPGRVVFTAPKRRTLDLPKDTIFPTAHSRRLLEAAKTAPKYVVMTVFDGAVAPGPMLVGAAVGKPFPLSNDTHGPAGALAHLRSWPMTLAFYPLDSRRAEPESEIAMRVYENGVGDAMQLDFGRFRVKADLVRIELGRHPSCGA